MMRFSTAKGYSLFQDAADLLDIIRQSKRGAGRQTGNQWPWENTIVGVISNSDDRVPGVLRDLGIDVAGHRFDHKDQYSTGGRKFPPHIDFSLLSYDAGCEKPNPEIFHKAHEIALKLPAASDVDDYEHLHVGDSISKDVLGSQAAGWNSILIDRDGHKESQMQDDAGAESEETKTIHIVRNLVDVRLWKHGLKATSLRLP